MAEAVLVHGAERLAVRTIEQLRLLDVEVVELGAIDVAELEARLAQGGAQALVLCDEGGIVNFHLALVPREHQPELRRLFNLELGAQAERLLGCRALSASQLAAPAFVDALRDDYAQRIHVGEHELQVLHGAGSAPLLALDSAAGRGVPVLRHRRRCGQPRGRPGRSRGESRPALKMRSDSSSATSSRLSGRRAAWPTWPTAKTWFQNEHAHSETRFNPSRRRSSRRRSSCAPSGHRPCCR